MHGTQKTRGFAKVSPQVIQNANTRASLNVTHTQTTQTTLQTLDLEQSQYVEYLFYDKLPHMVSKYSIKYDGSVHAKWAKSLFYLYQKEKIPIEKIEEYIVPLIEQIETIKHWSIENTLNTFTLMSKVGFFNQPNASSTNQDDIISLRNNFMSIINDKFHEIQITEKNVICYIGLLKCISIQIICDKNISSVSEKILNQVYSSFMQKEEHLTSYQYKEILQVIAEIGNRIHKYVPMFKLLIYKHLYCMANIEINSSNDINFMIYLSEISNLMLKNFPIEGQNKNNLIQLIHKINFAANNDTAISGLRSMTKLLDEEKILLKDVDNKINECINFIQDKNLDLLQTAVVLRSISKYIDLLNTLPENFKKIIDKYVNTLVKNKDFLSFDTLKLLLKTLRNLIQFDYPVSKIIIQLVELIDKNTIHFINSPPKEIHSTLTDLTRILLHSSRQLSGNLTLNFINFFNVSVPQYLKTILDTSLNEMLNSFITLSTLINAGYLANIDMQKSFNSLLSKIDRDLHLLNQKQLVNFFRVICLNQNLFILKDDKIIQYAKKLLELKTTIPLKEDSVQIEAITLWCLLVFYETNYEKFSKKMLNKYKEAIISLYKLLNSKKQNNQIVYSDTITYLFAANWLGYKIKVPFVQSSMEKNKMEIQCLQALQAKFDELFFEVEQSINGLPPCDIVVHDKKIAIEVQGMHHFLDIERTLVNGTTILKNALLRKNNYHVIEVKVTNAKISDTEIEDCFDKIKQILNQTQSLQKLNF